ncbi:MAG: isoprenylcysteine carboxylmethyltransferase family protein [Candidatus Omnitrophica bacterium]|nr:isoprenylcysteine carboxylmethyltransferase family protein [Candidatus Omnitrophota bacterium]
MAIDEKLKRRLSRLFKPRFAVLYPLAAWALIWGYSTIHSIMQGAWFILPGLVIRSWANFYAVKMEKLTTCGPYAYVRHPLYLGSFLIVLGFLTMLNVHWVVAIICLGVVGGTVYNVTVRNEDGMLTKKFGQEYLEYKKRVPAFFPAARPYRNGPQWNWSVERYLRSQEYKLFLWTAILTIFFYLKTKLLIEKGGFDAGVITLIVVAVFLALVDVAGEFFRKKGKVFVALLVLSAAVVISAAAACAEDGVFITRYSCKDLEGKQRWEATATIIALKDKGDNVYLITEEGSGLYYGFKVPVRWKSDTEFISNEKNIIPLRAKRLVFSESGILLLQESQEFDPEKREVTCHRKRPGTGEDILRSFRYEGDIVNRLLLSLYIQKFLENGKLEKVFYVLSNEPSLYKVTASVTGKKEITINGAKYLAYKICLNPHIGLLSPLKIILPKVYVWHLAAPKFNWLKCKGPEETVSSPTVEIETLDTLR